MRRMSVGSPTPSLESLSGTPLGSLIDSDPPRSLENSPPASTTGKTPILLKCTHNNHYLFLSVLYFLPPFVLIIFSFSTNYIYIIYMDVFKDVSSVGGA